VPVTPTTVTPATTTVTPTTTTVTAPTLVTPTTVTAPIDGFAKMTPSTTPSTLPVVTSTTTRATMADTAPAKGPALSPREPREVVRRTLVDGQAVSLREDGSGRLGTTRLAPGLDLGALGDLPCLATMAPFLDASGPVVLLRGTGDGADRLVRVGDGFVDGSNHGLLVRDGRFLAVVNDTIRDDGGALVGVVRRGGDGVPVPVFLDGTPTMLRRLAKVLRDEDSVLRRIPGDDGTRWHTFEGFAVDVDGALLAQRVSLSASPMGSRALYENGAGQAFVVEHSRSSGESLRITPAQDGPLAGASPPGVGCQWAVVGGRLAVLDDARPGLAFAGDGAPFARTDGQSMPAGTVVEGRPASSGRFLAVRTEAGGVVLARMEHSHGDENLVRVDGEATIVGRSGRRQGVLGDPPAIIVHDGVALTVVASSHGGRRLVGRGDGVVCAFDVKRSASLGLSVVPRTAVGEAHAVRRNGVLEDILVDGTRFAVARAPVDRPGLASDVLAAIDLVGLANGGRVEDVALSRTAWTMASALRAALDDATTEPALTDRQTRRTALADAIHSGRGAFVDVLAGLGGLKGLEGAFGLVANDDVIVAFRESGRVRRTPGSFQGPGAAHLAALFRVDGDGVVPLTIAEVRQRFDALVGSPTPTPTPATPTTTRDITVQRHPDGTATLAVGPRTIDVSGVAGPNHPSIDDVVGWLAGLPATALQAVEHVRFGPHDPSGQARFSPASGTLTFNPTTPDFWRDQGQTITIHEVVGHGLEQSNPQVLRALCMARILDGAGGTWVGTDDPYGDTNLAESFAVGVQELFADESARSRRPAFARLVDALIAGGPFGVYGNLPPTP